MDATKKIISSPEFIPGRGLTNNNTHHNVYNNSFPRQEGHGTTYYFVSNAVVPESVNLENGVEIVSLKY